MTDADAEFERRWATWQAAGLGQERARRRHMALIAGGAASVAAVVFVIMFLT
jgi:hypothetical protein